MSRTQNMNPEAEAKAKAEAEASRVKRVKYMAPRIPGALADDIYVNVNGESYLIKRGVEVEIPEYVVEVLRNSSRAEEVAASRIEELTAKARNL